MSSAFIRWGGRVFTPGAWHRVPFQPIIYTFTFFGALRIAFGDSPPIPFDNLGAAADNGWLALALAGPLLALWSWWLIMHSHRVRSVWVGMWIRLSADIAQFSALLVFHLATAFKEGWPGEAHAYVRYVYASVMLFVFALIVRDVWDIVATNRLSRTLR